MLCIIPTTIHFPPVCASPNMYATLSSTKGILDADRIVRLPLLGGGPTADDPLFNISLNSTNFMDSNLVMLPDYIGYCIYSNSASSFTNSFSPSTRIESPSGDFPYSRLAALQSFNNTHIPDTIYHQKNSTALVEQIFDNVERTWISTEINLADLPQQTPWTSVSELD